MLAVERARDLVTVTVLGELMLDDFREFEQTVEEELADHDHVDILLDLTEMTGFTVDAAWEDLRFSRQHNRDFRRIAVVTSDQWLTWLAWLNGAFINAEVQTFPERSDAEHWLATAR